MEPDDPMRAAARDNGVVDAWQGARVRHRADRAYRAAASRGWAEIDIGEPHTPLVVGGFVLVTLFATLVEFSKLGTHPSAQALDGFGGSSAIALYRGDWSSAVLANLLHGSLTHIALNLFIIVLVGRWVEHLAGRLVTLAVVTWSMLATTTGALLLDPRVVSVGASGVAFGIIGCAVAIDPRARTTAGTLARTFAIVNVVGTFVVPGISIGGHLGGLAAGLLVGYVCWSRAVDDDRPVGRPRRAVAAVFALPALLTIVALLAVHAVDRERAVTWGRATATWLVER
ncbi:MAG: rhomboid family intrarane serine protease [Thermoleophilia bacterium]|nr:rhomboid family intrarane serine protease [Thermoleophilia bacterium]